ncbi:TPA: hypothetical protein DCX15_02435 [bacterium]|nr:hypothetical protein [bacterium]
MKICYLGGGFHTIRWLSYFVKKGHKVSLISIDTPEIEGVKVYNLKEKVISHYMQLGHSSFIAKVHEIRRIIQAIQPDLLHAHFIPPYGYWAAMTDFHPFVLTPWRSDLFLNPYASEYNLEMAKFTLEKADLITVDSEALGSKAIFFGAQRDKIMNIQWGVNLSQFNPKIASDIRDKFCLGDSKVVISMRNFNPKYNLESLIKAIPAILKKVPSAKFLFLGEGDFKERLSEMIESLGLTKFVYLIGKVTHMDVPQYLVASDIFVSIPVTDATSLSLLEAMACGVAPVVSDLPSNREWITNGYNGYLVPVKLHIKGPMWEATTDIIFLINHIVELIEKDDLRKDFARRNFDIVSERADHYKHAEHMESLYKILIEKRRKNEY